MKIFISSILSILLFTGFSLDQKHQLVLERSSIDWIGTKVTGEHSGTIDFKSGEIRIQDDKIIGGKLIVNMSSIKVTDLEGKWAEKLEGHLSSEDFFNTNQYPTATFTFATMKPMEDGKYDIMGIMEIKGIKKPISFPAEVKIQGKGIRLKAEVVIDRTDFGIKYGSAKYFSDIGDKAIHDEFTLNVDLYAETEG